MDGWDQREAGEIAAAVTRGDVSAVEVTEQALARIAARDDELRCFRQVWATRARSRARALDRAVARGARSRRWAAILGGSKAGYGRIAQVVTVYQNARRGTKAILVWDGTGRRQDAWFEYMRVEPGQWLLLEGSDGYGWHHRTDCHYVSPGQLLVTAADSAPDCYRRDQRRREQRKA